MSISVVIPAYNEERLLPMCLSALRSQEDSSDEIIVVDNNSSDATAEIARQFGVTVVHEPRQGIVFARDTGFNAATGDIIARCDADSVPPSSWVKDIRRLFADQSVDATTGSFLFSDLRYGEAIKKLRLFSAYIRATRAIYGHNPLFGGNMALRRSAWLSVREGLCADETKVHEDLDLAIHLNDSGATIRYEEALVMPTSARRLRHSLPELARYAAKWPGTKLHHIR